MSYVPGVEEPKHDEEEKEEEEKEKEVFPLASYREVYSFGEGKFWLVLGGFFSSVVSGCVFPAIAFVFANSFQELGASSTDEDFLADIRRIAYIMMVLG